MPTFLFWVTVISTLTICFAVWGMLVLSLKRTSLEACARKTFTIVSAAYLFGWWSVMSVLAGAGVFAASPNSVIPSITIPLGVSVPIIGGLLLMKISPTLQAVIEAVPHRFLIGIQFYRTLGIIFIGHYLLGALPAEFALPAGIGDIIVGAVAPVVGYFLATNRRSGKNSVIAWNVFGILDLVVAVACGFLTSPSPLQSLAMQNPNRLVTAFPLVLVPVFAVPLSILLHIASLKRLKTRTQTADVRGNESFVLVSVKN